jgi:hypothetical protein
MYRGCVRILVWGGGDSVIQSAWGGGANQDALSEQVRRGSALTQEFG